MLREMRKSGSWKDEDEDKAGFGAETLFDTLDMELASYITKAQGLRPREVAGEAGDGSGAARTRCRRRLPSLDAAVPRVFRPAS